MDFGWEATFSIERSKMNEASCVPARRLRAAPPGYVVDRRALPSAWITRAGSHSILLVGFLLYTFVGTSPFASNVSMADRVDGSAFDRIAVLSLFALSIAVLWENRRAAVTCLRSNVSLFLVVGFSLLSIVWSDYPDLTLSRAMLLLLMSAITMAIVVGLTSPRRLHTILFASLTVIILINLAFTAIAPSRAVTDIGVRGFYSQKNVAGLVAMVTMIFGFTWILGAQKARSVFLGLAALAPTLLFLIISRSKTSINLTVLMFAISGLFVLTELLGERFALFIIFCALALISILLGLFAALDFDIQYVLGVVVGDKSFTGRDEIWAFALRSASKRPWLGYGYGAFWDVGAGNDPLLRVETGSWLADVELGKINEAHNGYLDLWLHIGLPATVFATLTIFRGMLLASKFAVSSPASRETRATLGAMALLLFLYLFHNLTESTLFMRGAQLSNIAILALFVISRAPDLAARANSGAAGSSK
jgi:exopolysaccharide production protein ExoQ